ncbi:MAG: FAD-binding protein [Halofilum sp. (in: g-proteobacteria)]|nr:FAD-binding protein [Halofilum sp. (in: g-proteobacteria)]
MSAILVYAEHDHTELKSGTLSAIACARELGGDIDILVTGSGCADAARQAASIEGVRKVLLAEGEHLENHVAENVAPIIERLAGDYDYVLAAATTGGKNIMPRVAAKLDVQQISDISAVVSADTFVRPIYAGNAMATVQSTDATKLITVRATSFDAVEPGGGSAEVETIDAGTDAGLARFVGADLSASEGPELTTARIVVSGGRGVGSAENFQLIESLAGKMGAAVGASRAAVDAGYVPNDYQVGQTGKVVAPDLYMAVGISGAIQHMAGMKESRVIVAINKDPEAPIFEVADYGLVADLFEALPELDKALGG